jgi:hypothetical protein
MRIWQLSALTESLTFSLLSGLVAGGLLLGSRWRWDGAALWGFGLVCFGLLRPANALIVPFLLAPLLPQLRPLCRSRPAPAGPVAAPGRFFAAMGLAICVALAGWLLAERSEFWRMNYTTALMERVVTDAEARDYFRAAGMPTPVVWGSDAFSEWFEAHARATYQGWVISRAQSYADAWWWLRPDWQRDEILERYGDRAGILRLDSAAWRPASWLYSATAPPRALWLTALLGALALTVWRRPPGVHAVVASLLAVGAYVQCFVALHASAAEEVRHTLGASMLYRIAFMLVLRGIWDALSSGLRGR